MRKMVAFLLLLGSATLLVWGAQGSSGDAPAQKFTDYNVISHAMGGIRDHAYTNSYEAFIANYEKGSRVFEVDLLLTEDGKLVARHEWTSYMTQLLEQEKDLPADRQAVPLSYHEFKSSPILGSYQPLDWGDIVKLLEQYPDIYIVTDTKEQDEDKMKQELEMVVKSARDRNPELLNRIVPQIYNQPMLEMVQRIYPFPSIIYTLYASQDSDQEVIDFVSSHSIDAVTMPEHRASRSFISKLKKVGVACYIHTINGLGDVNKYQKMGANGVYSDFLTEEEAKSSRWKVAFGF